MQDFIQTIIDTLAEGKGGALVSVLESRGSAPRGPGAAMFVLQDGKQFGTVGGGVLEHAAALRAIECIGTRKTAIETFRLDNSEAGALGMVCGGQVTVLIEPVLPGTKLAAVIRELSDRLKLNKTMQLVRRISGQTVSEYALQAACNTKTSFVRDGESSIFTLHVGPKGRAVVFGGGHVSLALVPQLSSVRFSVTVCEDRPEFATKERFPTADCILTGDYALLFDKLDVTPSDALISMTRGHEADLAILSLALKTDASYIGCIGSRSKIAYTHEMLAKQGFTETDFKRIHSPIGLAIGAETPEEIAVSIAAELIAHRAGIMV